MNYPRTDTERRYFDDYVAAIVPIVAGLLAGGNHDPVTSAENILDDVFHSASRHAESNCMIDGEVLHERIMAAQKLMDEKMDKSNTKSSST